MTYNYDDRDQLVEADYDTQGDEAYTYDENGNRVGTQTIDGSSQTYASSAGSNNRLLNDGTFTYTYDNEGNRITRTRISSATVNDKTTEYTWDQRNRLTQVTFKNNSGTVTKTVAYTYDADNQLLRRTVDPDGATGSTAIKQTFFIHDDGQIVLQFDKMGSGAVAASNLSHRYLWGPAVDQLLADEQVNWSDSDADGPILWALTDHLGTVRDLIDSAGVVKNHRAYDAFGNILSETDAAFEQLFGFTGRPLDEHSGLQNNLHRWFEGSTGKWMSEDPIGFGGGDANLSRYVGNSVLTSVDPSGLATTGSQINIDYSQDTGFWYQYFHYSEWGNNVKADPWWLNWGTEVTDVASYAGGLTAVWKVGLKKGLKAAVKEAAKQTAEEVTGLPLPGKRRSGFDDQLTDQLRIQNKAQQARDTAPPKGLGYRTLSASQRAEYNVFADRARARGYVQNPYRTGSWGEMVNGKFVERVRMDVGNPGLPKNRGKTHLNFPGDGDHYPPHTPLP